MRPIKIMTDSCADLNSAQLEKYGIVYAKMATVCDGIESPALLTWSDGEAHGHYERMREGKRITTSQVSMEEFREAFSKEIDAGFDVVYIGCSSKSSGSVHTGELVARDLLAEHPEARIVCIDSLNASIGEGMLAIEAAKMAADGASLDLIAESILSMRKKVNQYVTVHSLDALRRSGRINSSTAFFGNLLGVKPIIIADANGDQAAYRKARGRRKSFEEIVALLKESIVSPEEQTVYLTHADCAPEEVDQLVSLIRREIPCRDIEIGFIGPIIGASIGPDAIGIWAFGREVTYRVAEA